MWVGVGGRGIEKEGLSHEFRSPSAGQGWEL